MIKKAVSIKKMSPAMMKLEEHMEKSKPAKMKKASKKYK